MVVSVDWPAADGRPSSGLSVSVRRRRARARPRRAHGLSSRTVSPPPPLQPSRLSRSRAAAFAPCAVASPLDTRRAASASAHPHRFRRASAASASAHPRRWRRASASSPTSRASSAARAHPAAASRADSSRSRRSDASLDGATRRRLARLRSRPNTGASGASWSWREHADLAGEHAGARLAWRGERRPAAVLSFEPPSATRGGAPAARTASQARQTATARGAPRTSQTAARAPSARGTRPRAPPPAAAPPRRVGSLAPAVALVRELSTCAQQRHAGHQATPCS